MQLLNIILEDNTFSSLINYWLSQTNYPVFFFFFYKYKLSSFFFFTLKVKKLNASSICCRARESKAQEGSTCSGKTVEEATQKSPAKSRLVAGARQA